MNTTDKIDIRKSEDELFEKWAIKRHPFATDGCSNPEKYLLASSRIVFVLKERNWGHTIEEQRVLQATRKKEIYDERENFNSWWTVMAQWADALLQDDDDCKSWSDIINSFTPGPEVLDREEYINKRNKKSLDQCAIMQLKKSPGGGKLNREELNTVVREDRDFILRQFSLYRPHYIVSCGSNDSWSLFTDILFDNIKINQTRNGVVYFLVQIEGVEHKTAVINFAHPSMRINATLWGLLAFGLRDALTEISCHLMRSK